MLSAKEKLVIKVSKANRQWTASQVYRELVRRGKNLSLFYVNGIMKKRGLGSRRAYRFTGANSKLHRFAHQAGRMAVMTKYQKLKTVIQQARQNAAELGLTLQVRTGKLV
jgi:hypothetical protein